MGTRETAEEFRGVVRSMIRELLPEIAKLKTHGTPAAAGTANALGDQISALARRQGGGTVKVRIANDEDLRSFAAVLITCPDPVAQAAVLEGKVKLELIGETATATQPHSGTTTQGTTVEIAEGVVSETRVGELAKQGATLVLGRKAVLTPLARDKARTSRLRVIRKDK